jgi:uncharacterized membrane protein YhfC
MQIDNPIAKVISIAIAVLCWLVMARVMQKERLNLSAQALFVGSCAVFFYIQYIAISVAMK